MSQSRPPVTYGLTVSGDTYNVEHSVGSTVVNPNVSLAEMRRLRDKQREDLMKQGGGVSVSLIITREENAKKVTAISSPAEKKESNPKTTENEKYVTHTGKSEAILTSQSSTPASLDNGSSTFGSTSTSRYSSSSSAVESKSVVSSEVVNNAELPTIQQLNDMGILVKLSIASDANVDNVSARCGTMTLTSQPNRHSAEQQRAASSALSAHPSASVSLNNVSSTFASTSSAVFRAVSKKPNSTTTNLPTAKELNDILGNSDLVTKVESTYSFCVLIEFNPAINPNSYEQILNQKLLGDISNVSLSKMGDCPRLGIPKEAYEQFMKNVAVNKPVAQLRA